MNRIRSSRWLAPVLAAALLAGLLAAPAGASQATREQSTKVTVTGAALPTSDKVGSPDDPAIGKVAPTISGQSFDGKTVTIGGAGKPRVVLFLAHWCPHCRAEVPRIVKLAKADKLSGVEIQAVATDTSKNLPNYPPSKWLKREKWPFNPVLADDAKFRALQAYGGDSFPFFVIVGADGKVLARATGELSDQSVITAAKNLAAGKSLFPPSSK
jgi:thiol-disulfide isomerase/thioredoxin